MIESTGLLALRIRFSQMIILALGVMATATGCGLMLEHRDVLTGRKEYWGGFQPGQKYVLVQDVFLVNGKLSRFYPYKPDHDRPFFVKSLSVADYRALKIVDKNVKIISAGTKVQCSRIIGFRNVSYSLITVYGKILISPPNYQEVSFGDLAAGKELPHASPYADAPTPDPQFLRAVSDSEL